MWNDTEEGRLGPMASAGAALENMFPGNVRLNEILKYIQLGNVSENDSDAIMHILQIYKGRYLRNGSEGIRTGSYNDVWDFLEDVQGPRRGELRTVIVITFIYCFIFLSGIFGNVCTCLVILTNKYMHTATNYYLFNLAIADLLLLLIGLPPDTYYIWSAYPWVFGGPFCIIRTMLAETSTNASILTITAFTIERYVAICHPMKAHTMSHLKRVIRVIIAIWCLSIILSIPLTIQYKLVYAVDSNNRTIPESAGCNIGEGSHLDLTFELSTFLFFVFPMTLVSVMYTLIAIAIRKSGLNRDDSDSSNHHNPDRLTQNEIRHRQQTKAKRSVVKMLVAVVVAFFVCWAPFHAQRLMTLYIPPAQWSKGMHESHTIIYYVSGICYFLSCTINPLLYNIMSLKFRQAFKQTVLKPWGCKRPLRNARTRAYFSQRFSHKNGYSETSFTSVDAGSPARIVNSNHSVHEHFGNTRPLIGGERGGAPKDYTNPMSGNRTCDSEVRQHMRGNTGEELELRQTLQHIMHSIDGNCNTATRPQVDRAQHPMDITL